MANKSPYFRHPALNQCPWPERWILLISSYLLLGIGLLGVELFSGLVRAQDASEIHRTISFTAVDQSIVNALIRLGSQEHIPLGIVLQKADSICNQHKTVNAVNTTAFQIINMLLDGTDKTFLPKGKVIEVRPKQISARTAAILKMRYEDYSSMATNMGGLTTMHGLGVILSGRISMRLHPGRGYGGSIIGSLDAQQLPAFKLKNVSVEDIADYIVSLGGRGVWIFYQPAETQRAPDGEVQLKTYSYIDDRTALLTEPCSTQ